LPIQPFNLCFVTVFIFIFQHAEFAGLHAEETAVTGVALDDFAVDFVVKISAVGTFGEAGAAADAEVVIDIPVLLRGVKFDRIDGTIFRTEGVAALPADRRAVPAGEGLQIDSDTGRFRMVCPAPGDAADRLAGQAAGAEMCFLENDPFHENVFSSFKGNSVRVMPSIRLSS
jgi:hypothetical protein